MGSTWLSQYYDYGNLFQCFPSAPLTCPDCFYWIMCPHPTHLYNINPMSPQLNFPDPIIDVGKCLMDNLQFSKLIECTGFSPNDYTSFG